MELSSSGDRLLTFRLVVPGDTIALDKQIFRTTEGTTGDVRTVRYETELAAAAARRGTCRSRTRFSPTAIA